jgi:hypothetical protein
LLWEQDFDPMLAKVITKGKNEA